MICVFKLHLCTTTFYTNAHLQLTENEEEEEVVVVATVTHLHQGHGDALEVGGGVEGPADQGPQQLDVPQEHVEDQQLPVVIGGPEEAGQRGGEAMEVVRQHLHESLAGAGAGIVTVATVAPTLRRRPQGRLTSAGGDLTLLTAECCYCLVYTPLGQPGQTAG